MVNQLLFCGTSIDVGKFAKGKSVLILSGNHTNFKIQAENSYEKIVITPAPPAGIKPMPLNALL